MPIFTIPRSELEELLSCFSRLTGPDPDRLRINRILEKSRAPEITGSGSEYTDEAHIVHHCYDGEPHMPGSRTYPPKWVIVEYERLLRRIRRATAR